MLKEKIKDLFKKRVKDTNYQESILESLTEDQRQALISQIKTFQKINQKPEVEIDRKRGYVVFPIQMEEKEHFYLTKAEDLSETVVQSLSDLDLHRDTLSEGKKLIEQLKIHKKLKLWSKLCEHPLKWTDEHQVKYALFLEPEFGSLTIMRVNEKGKDVYFTDKSVLERAIVDIGEETIKQYYFD